MRHEIKGLDGSVLKDVKVRNAFPCKKGTGNLAALESMKRVEMSWDREGVKEAVLRTVLH
jgi:hypothetical protein